MPKFTRQHYEALTTILANATKGLSDHSACDVAVTFADAFSEDNPKFNRMKFLCRAGEIRAGKG